MIFLTVGTQFPFDRLVKAVDGLNDRLLNCAGPIVAQVGQSSYRPRNFEPLRSLPKDAFDSCLRNADYIISHAGMGSITMALQYSKPLLVMPRLMRYHEVVNDHQLAIARRFESLGHLLVAWQPSDLPSRFEELTSFRPARRQAQPALVAARIHQFLAAQPQLLTNQA